MPLDDTGLLARYYLDEAASGTTPPAALDTSGIGAAYDLTIDYGAGNLAYTVVGGQRGLASASATGSQKARKQIVAADKLSSAFVGSHQTGTLEIVLNIASFSASGGRVFGINNRAGGNGGLLLAGTGGAAWQVRHNDQVRRTWDGTENVRQVIHVVIDTNQVADSNKVRVYVDGSLIATTEDSNPVTSENFTIADGADLIMFNRESGGSFDRSIVGTIYYAAIYSAAMSSVNITNNAGVLLTSDDTPGGGGGGGPVPLDGGRLPRERQRTRPRMFAPGLAR